MEKKQMVWPFLAIVAIVAIVAVVVLVMNFKSSALVVDKEGNVIGEAYSLMKKLPNSAGISTNAKLEKCPEDSSKTCCNGTINQCRTLCTQSGVSCWRTYSSAH